MEAVHPGLIAGFQRGEKTALETLYRIHSPLLHRLFRAWCARKHYTASPEDMVQEAFCRVFSIDSRRSFDTARTFQPYLVAIARHVLIDTGKADLRRRRMANAFTAHSRADSFDSSACPADQDVLALGLARSYVTSVPEPLEAVFRARFVAGRSQREAAKALGLTHQRLRTLEERLLAGLGARLSCRKSANTNVVLARSTSRQTARLPAR